MEENMIRKAMGNQSKDIPFSAVIPVYNEEDCLEELYQRLTAVLREVSESYEIIFVDDGSKDRSFPLLERLHRSDTRVKVIRFTRSFGQPYAISAGLKVAQGKRVVVLDADLQNPPEEIPKLAKEMNNGYDIVYGLRKNRRDPLLRKLGSLLFYWYMVRILGVELPPGVSAFRIMNRSMVDQFNSLPEKTRFFAALSCWLGAQYTCVEIEHSERKRGRSKYSFYKLLWMFINPIIAFSSLPLRWIGFAGILVAVASLLTAVNFILRKVLLGITVPGYSSLIVSILFLSGVQLMSLGIIGEYLSRVYTEVQGRPMYVIRETLGLSIEQAISSDR